MHIIVATAVLNSPYMVSKITRTLEEKILSNWTVGKIPLGIYVKRNCGRISVGRR